MNLQIYLDTSGKIIKIEPSEEFSSRIGDDLIINNTTYSIIKIDTEEFLDYELVVNKIEVAELLRGDNNGIH